MYKARKADILHAHFSFMGWSYLKVARRSGLPLVVSFYGYDYEWLLRSEPIWRERYNIMFKEASLFLSEGLAGRDKLIRAGCPEEKVKVAHLGVDVSRIKFYSRDKKRGELYLIQVASFTAKKGHDVTIRAFIRAAASCPGMTLTFVGKDPDGIMRPLREKLTEAGLNDRFKFVDGVDFDKLHGFLKDYHVFIHPSRYSESGDSEGGAPIVLLDAQATGMPVLSTTHCDIPDEVVDGVTGMLVAENDDEALARAIKSFYDMEGEEYARYCRDARRHIEKNYDARVCAARLRGIYEGVLKPEGA